MLCSHMSHHLVTSPVGLDLWVVGLHVFACLCTSRYVLSVSNYMKIKFTKGLHKLGGHPEPEDSRCPSVGGERGRAGGQQVTSSETEGPAFRPCFLSWSRAPSHLPWSGRGPTANLGNLSPPRDVGSQLELAVPV